MYYIIFAFYRALVNKVNFYDLSFNNFSIYKDVIKALILACLKEKKMYLLQLIIKFIKIIL